MVRTFGLTLEERFWNLVEKTDSCWLWKGSKVPKGYGTFRFNNKNYRAHRVSWQLAHGPIGDNEICVLHKCDNPNCVRPDHLFLGTNKDNTNDMLLKGREARGERNGHARLDCEKVVAMRRARANGIPFSKLGKMFNVSYVTAFDACTGKTWKHVI